MNTGYQKYLDSEHWENLRLARLAQSRGLCLLCEFRAIQPQVHHTTYGPTLWTVSKRSLKPLCSECHSFAHAIADLYKSNTIGMTPREKWTFIRQKAIMLWSNKTRLPMGESWGKPELIIPEHQTKPDSVYQYERARPLNQREKKTLRNRKRKAKKRTLLIEYLVALAESTFQFNHKQNI